MRDHIFEEIDSITVEKKVWFVNKFRNEHKLILLLKAVKLGKSTFFDNLNRIESSQSKKKKEISKQIILIHDQFNQVYGARKIARELHKKGIITTERTVSNYMKELKIRSIRAIKAYKSKSNNKSNDDCINYLKNEKINEINTIISTDMTYIYTINDGWVYQLTFMDLMTRKILHYEVSKKMDDHFVSSNTEKLLKKFPTIKMIHADRGSQYTSKIFRKL